VEERHYNYAVQSILPKFIYLSLFPRYGSWGTVLTAHRVFGKPHHIPQQRITMHCLWIKKIKINDWPVWKN
jgi:hypothetical protein